MLIPGDLGRIAERLGRPLLEVAADYFWASPGALLAHRPSGRVLAIPTITPRRDRGRCVFLDDEHRCTIHDVAPFGCAYFDTHMPSDESQTRSLWGHALIASCKAYTSIRATLPPADSYNPRLY